MYQQTNTSVVDVVPANMRYMVPNHWYRFPPINPAWHKILALTLSIFSLLSIVGNGLVLYLTRTTKSLQSPPNLLICNLAISDFSMMAINAPMMVINCLFETWIFGGFMCEFYGLQASLVGNVSILSLVFISLDRHNVIVKGFSAKPLTTKRAIRQIAFIWIFGLAWTIPPLFGWSRYVPEGNMTSCTIDYFSRELKDASYLIVYAIVVYFIPLGIIVYCYTMIVVHVARHEENLRQQAKRMNVASLKANVDIMKGRSEIHLAKVSFFTIMCWFTAWTPYLIIALYGIFGSGDYLTPLVSIWGALFAKTAAVYNPIVYAISHPKYQGELTKRFPWFQRLRSSSGAMSGASMSGASMGKRVQMRKREQQQEERREQIEMKEIEHAA